MMISLISTFLTYQLLCLTILNIYTISVQFIFTLGVGFNASFGWLFCVICNLVFAQFLGSVFLFISLQIVLLLLVLAFGRSGLFCDICNLAFTPFFGSVFLFISFFIIILLLALAFRYDSGFAHLTISFPYRFLAPPLCLRYLYFSYVFQYKCNVISI